MYSSNLENRTETKGSNDNWGLQTKIDGMRSKEDTPKTDKLKTFSGNRLTKKYPMSSVIGKRH